MSSNFQAGRLRKTSGNPDRRRIRHAGQLKLAHFEFEGSKISKLATVLKHRLRTQVALPRCAEKVIKHLNVKRRNECDTARIRMQVFYQKCQVAVALVPI